MRLSPARLVLRAVLLLGAAAFMIWRGFDTRARAADPLLDPASALLLGRIALVEWVLGALALLNGAFAVAALRTPRPDRSRQ